MELRKEKKAQQVIISKVTALYEQTIELARKEEVILRAKEELEKQLSYLREEYNGLKVSKEKARQEIEGGQAKNQTGSPD